MELSPRVLGEEEVKKETADDLIRWYADVFAERMEDEVFSEIVDRWDAIPPEDRSESKTMRWLGFAQGAAVALGVFTLDEIKEHSRRAVEEEGA